MTTFSPHYTSLATLRTNAVFSSISSTSQPSLPKRQRRQQQPTNPEITITQAIAEGLSAQQHHILTLVAQGQSVFFTGKAGAGKSHTLKRIIQLCRQQFPDDGMVAVTASTGIAALQIDGQTIHAFAGCGLGEEHAYDMIKNMSEAAKKRWRKVKVLILDEVSMVNGQFFDDLHSVAASLRTEHGLFGGIQLIVCGDFLQLPPVVKPPKLAQFAFESGVWSSLFKDGVVALTKIYRQSETDFIDALNEIRYGANAISSKTETLMRSCSRELACPDGLKPTQLFSTRDEVDRCNLGHLEALSGNTFGFFAKLTGNAVKLRELVGRVLAPELLELKVGAQVMLVKNLGDGLANGSIGTVKDVCINERKVTVKFAAVGSAPAITRTLEPEVWSFSDTFTGIETSFEQIPLCLAYAMTIHKSQGQTIRYLKVDLSRTFAPGQVYVAISRAVSLDGLQVVGFQKNKVIANGKVIAYYKKIGL